MHSVQRDAALCIIIALSLRYYASSSLCIIMRHAYRHLCRINNRCVFYTPAVEAIVLLFLFGTTLTSLLCLFARIVWIAGQGCSGAREVAWRFDRLVNKAEERRALEQVDPPCSRSSNAYKTSRWRQRRSVPRKFGAEEKENSLLRSSRRPPPPPDCQIIKPYHRC